MMLCFSFLADIEVDCDPFSMTETDPAKCGALESCLWEVKVNITALICMYIPGSVYIARPPESSLVEMPGHEASVG